MNGVGSVSVSVRVRERRGDEKCVKLIPARTFRQVASCSARSDAHLVWGPQGQGFKGVKMMVKSVAGRRTAPLESYGRR